MIRLTFNVFADRVSNDTLWYHIWVQPNWLHYEIYLFGLCLLVIFVVSFFTKRASEEQLVGVTYFSSTPEQRAETRASYSKWDVINSLVIIGVIVAFYIVFWK
jgi:SSS family solute:Na+ symporter